MGPRSGSTGGLEHASRHERLVLRLALADHVALKVGEGIADYILEEVRSVIRSSPLFAPAALLLKPALRRALKRLQYEEYGGANLLGVNGVVVIAHGRSDALAIKNALRVARAAATSGIIATMRQSFAAQPETTASAT